MSVPDADFVVSTEQECMTVVREPEDPIALELGLTDFLDSMRSIAPAVSCHAGFFNGYGRVYLDCGAHVELAAIECDSPYLLAQVVETQHNLASDAVALLRERGTDLLLAGNNHSGLLEPATATWGSHENYLVARNPLEFGDDILPFLVSRVFGGAGGIEFPSGAYLAAVRPVFMQHDSGGQTTGNRAIHSTSRQEHHMGPRPARFRYHLILGDGHRSQFNLALQFGATALALKAIELDPGLGARALGAAPRLAGGWLPLLSQFNRLALPGQPPRVSRLALAIQRVYLDGAKRWADALGEPPAWVARSLRDWEDTLAAFGSDDFDWLSTRLDAFIKYRLFSAVLADAGYTWSDLPNDRPMFCELALIDHSYHSFCDPASTFDELARAGHLDHRVGAPIEAGTEPEPFVPETRTRARARARWIKEHASRDHMFVDWSCVQDRRTRRYRKLDDPFATEYGPWVAGSAW